MGYNTSTQKLVFHGRYMDDVCKGIGLAIHDEYPLRSKWDPILTKTLKQELPLIHFLETIKFNSFKNIPPQPFFRFDDMGRGYILGILFNLLQGVSPYLIFWLGLLFFIMIFFWISLEYFLCDLWVYNYVLCFTFGFSSYLYSILSLTYSASGFYILSFLSLLPICIYTVFNRNKTIIGCFIRITITSIILSICLICRSSSIAAYIGVGIVILKLSKDMTTSVKVKNKLWILFLSFLILIMPYIILHQHINNKIMHTLSKYSSNPSLGNHHPFWHIIWTGLGDFDKKNHYAVNDHMAVDFAKSKGWTTEFSNAAEGIDKQYEHILKTSIINDILNDPFWYLGILRKRFFSTLFQLKLYPWKFRDGIFLKSEESNRSNAIDFYYMLIPRADNFGINPYMMELPIELFIFPTWIIILVSFFSVINKSFVNIFQQEFFILFVVGVSSMILPVCVTTVAGIETQGFFIFYYLGFSFFIGKLIIYKFLKTK